MSELAVYRTKKIKLWLFDSYTAFPIVISGVHATVPTLYTALVVIAVLNILPLFKLDISRLIRRFKTALGTRRKAIRSPYRHLL